MTPKLPLNAGETLLWEGRPAPRCYTFRNWPHSLCGLILLGFAGVWLHLGIALAGESGDRLFVLLPLPFLPLGFWLAIGHLLAARFEWDRVWYAVTDTRLLVHRGLWRPRWAEMPLADLAWFRLQPHGAELGTLTVRAGVDGRDRLVLNCIEQPRVPAGLLEAALRRNGVVKSEE